MHHHLLIAEFLATPWALMPERLNAVAAVLARWSQDIPAGEDVLAGISVDRAVREARRQAAIAISSGGIAVLPLYGVVTQRGNMVDDVSGPGSVSTQQFASALRQALADDSVSQILIDIDSPGGSVYGVSELADEIISARTQKPICAIANSLAASAAYWIGCSASEFYVTPGGEVGSIGVWQAHFDYSQAFAAEGIQPTLISAGKYKVEGTRMRRSTKRLRVSCSRAWMTTTPVSPRRWRVGGVFRSLRCARGWARVGCLVPRRRWRRVWSMAWLPSMRSSGRCGGMRGPAPSLVHCAWHSRSGRSRFCNNRVLRLMSVWLDG